MDLNNDIRKLNYIYEEYCQKYPNVNEAYAVDQLRALYEAQIQDVMKFNELSEGQIRKKYQLQKVMKGDEDDDVDGDSNQLTNFSSISYKIWINNIFIYLSPSDLARVSQTCLNFYSFVHSPLLLYNYFSRKLNCQETSENENEGIISSILKIVPSIFNKANKLSNNQELEQRYNQQNSFEKTVMKQNRILVRGETMNKILTNKLKRNDKIVKQLLEQKNNLKQASVDIKEENKQCSEVIKKLDEELSKIDDLKIKLQEEVAFQQMEESSSAINVIKFLWKLPYLQIEQSKKAIEKQKHQNSVYMMEIKLLQKQMKKLNQQSKQLELELDELNRQSHKIYDIIENQ